MTNETVVGWTMGGGGHAELEEAGKEVMRKRE